MSVSDTDDLLPLVDDDQLMSGMVRQTRSWRSRIRRLGVQGAPESRQPAPWPWPGHVGHVGHGHGQSRSLLTANSPKRKDTTS